MSLWQYRVTERRTFYLHAEAGSKEEADALFEEYLGEDCEVLDDTMPDHVDVDFGSIRPWEGHVIPGNEPPRPDVFPGWKEA
jgi:hypothetical protein